MKRTQQIVMKRAFLVWIIAGAVIVAGCGSDDPAPTPDAKSPAPSSTAPSAEPPPSPRTFINGVVKVDRDRGLYVRCTGTGSPTVIMESGDESPSDYYGFAESSVAE